jgi:hypothetical protein
MCPAIPYKTKPVLGTDRLGLQEIESAAWYRSLDRRYGVHGSDESLSYRPGIWFHHSMAGDTADILILWRTGNASLDPGVDLG